ncbi:unnamed protein product, partial [Ectocarpus sp. 4 AP-2014]
MRSRAIGTSTVEISVLANLGFGLPSTRHIALSLQTTPQLFTNLPIPDASCRPLRNKPPTFLPIYSSPSVPYRSWKGPVEGTDKYDYRYTGRHDHGTLPALKTGGQHGELVKAIHDAKADSDAFLTELINKEASARDSKRTEAEPGGAALGGKPRATTGEAMELEPCGAEGGAEASPQGGAL